MTLRETYIQGLINTLRSVPAFPAGVERSISIAFTREESPVLVVHRGAEQIGNTIGGDTDRECEILVSVISRGDSPETEADEVMALAHPLIMSFKAVGMMLMEEVGTSAPLYSNTDGMACMLTSRYKIHYTSGRLSLGP